CAVLALVLTPDSAARSGQAVASTARCAPSPQGRSRAGSACACPGPRRHRTSVAWMPPHSEQIVSRICGALFRGSLTAVPTSDKPVGFLCPRVLRAQPT
ncbi:hypothetical protein IXO621_07390, partial [Xanthomonas oryzae pv. oryzae]